MAPKASNKKSTNDENVYEEEAVEEEIFEETFNNQHKSFAWLDGGKGKDKIIQKMLKYANEFGINNVNDDNTTAGEFIIGFDCLLNMKKFTTLIIDNDNRATRELLIQTSKYNIVSHKLAPLLRASIEDQQLITKCMILCNTLTYPIDADTAKHLTSIIKTTPLLKETKEEFQERITKEKAAQKNAYDQLHALISFKEALVHEEIFEVLLQYVSNSICLSASTRTPKDNKIIERVLVFISNLLAIDAGPFSTPEDIQLSKSLHIKLVLLLQNEFFDFIIFLCQSVREVENKVWLVLFLEISANITRGKDARDLFQIKLTTTTNIANNDNNNLSNRTTTTTTTNNNNNILNGSTNTNSMNKKRSSLSSSTGACPGELKHILSRERMERKSIGNSVGAVSHLSNSRFRGIYQVKVTPRTNNNTITNFLDDNDNNNNNSNNNNGDRITSRFLSGVISSDMSGLVCSIPTVSKKRMKRNMTCVKDDSSKKCTKYNYNESEMNKAIILYLDLLLQGALNELVFSAKEDWRRGDGLMGFQDEMNFFRLTTICMKYNRYILLEEQKRSDLATSGNKSPVSISVLPVDGNDSNLNMDSAEKNKLNNNNNNNNNISICNNFIPDLSNVMQCLDKMAYSRCTSAMTRLQLKGTPFLNYDLLHIPMEMYKEIVAYIKILLDSSDDAHHDLALGICYYLFYASQDREDPLPQLLRDWRPGIFGKRHLDILLELIHETLKTLETGWKVFSKNDSKKKYSRKERKALNDKGLEEKLEQNLIYALKFDVQEYFKRLVTNHTVEMYTRVLENISTNSPWVNHYVFCFLQRLCSFTILDDEDDDEDGMYGDNDVDVIKKKKKNSTKSDSSSDSVTLGHMLFNIQTLSTFSTILNDIVIVNEKMNAPLIRLIKSITRRFVTLSQKNKLIFVEALFQHSHPHRFIINDLEEVYGAKFYAKSVFSKETEMNSPTYKKSKSTSWEDDDIDESNDITNRKDRDKSTSKDKDWGDEFDDTAPINITTKRTRLTKIQKNKELKWTDEEDEELKTLFRLHKGHPKTFQDISKNIIQGRQRTVKQIETRVVKLRLHESIGVDTSDEEELGSDDDSEEVEDDDDEENVDGDDGDEDAPDADKNKLNTNDDTVDVIDNSDDEGVKKDAITLTNDKLKYNNDGSEIDNNENINNISVTSIINNNNYDIELENESEEEFEFDEEMIPLEYAIEFLNEAVVITEGNDENSINVLDQSINMDVDMDMNVPIMKDNIDINSIHINQIASTSNAITDKVSESEIPIQSIPTTKNNVQNKRSSNSKKRSLENNGLPSNKKITTNTNSNKENLNNDNSSNTKKKAFWDDDDNDDEGDGRWAAVNRLNNMPTSKKLNGDIQHNENTNITTISTSNKAIVRKLIKRNVLNDNDNDDDDDDIFG